MLNRIASLYSDNLKTKVARILFSVDIFGNPAGFFNNIKTGLFDFINEPIEGFIKGPLEGVEGIMEGTHSLVKNTAVGTLNSLSKITGTLSKGLNGITMDE